MPQIPSLKWRSVLCLSIIITRAFREEALCLPQHMWMPWAPLVGLWTPLNPCCDRKSRLMSLVALHFNSSSETTFKSSFPVVSSLPLSPYFFFPEDAFLLFPSFSLSLHSHRQPDHYCLSPFVISRKSFSLKIWHRWDGEGFLFSAFIFCYLLKGGHWAWIQNFMGVFQMWNFLSRKP